jgi:hypothetical protein
VNENVIFDSPPPASLLLVRSVVVSKGKLETDGRIIELESLDEGREFED